MDPILTAEVGLIDNEFDSKPGSAINSSDTFLNCLPGDSFTRNNEENSGQFFIASEADNKKTIVHPMNSDDIISAELPANLLDIDSSDKNEDSTVTENREQVFSCSISSDIVTENCHHRINEETKSYKENRNNEKTQFHPEDSVESNCNDAEILKSDCIQNNVEPLASNNDMKSVVETSTDETPFEKQDCENEETESHREDKTSKEAEFHAEDIEEPDCFDTGEVLKSDCIQKNVEPLANNSDIKSDVETSAEIVFEKQDCRNEETESHREDETSEEAKSHAKDTAESNYDNMEEVLKSDCVQENVEPLANNGDMKSVVEMSAAETRLEKQDCENEETESHREDKTSEEAKSNAEDTAESSCNDTENMLKAGCTEKNFEPLVSNVDLKLVDETSADETPSVKQNSGSEAEISVEQHPHSVSHSLVDEQCWAASEPCPSERDVRDSIDALNSQIDTAEETDVNFSPLPSCHSTESEKIVHLKSNVTEPPVISEDEPLKSDDPIIPTLEDENETICNVTTNLTGSAEVTGGTVNSTENCAAELSESSTLENTTQPEENANLAEMDLLDDSRGSNVFSVSAEEDSLGLNDSTKLVKGVFESNEVVNLVESSVDKSDPIKPVEDIAESNEVENSVTGIIDQSDVTEPLKDVIESSEVINSVEGTTDQSDPSKPVENEIESIQVIDSLDRTMDQSDCTKPTEHVAKLSEVINSVEGTVDQSDQSDPIKPVNDVVESSNIVDSPESIPDQFESTKPVEHVAESNKIVNPVKSTIDQSEPLEHVKDVGESNEATNSVDNTMNQSDQLQNCKVVLTKGLIEDFVCSVSCKKNDTTDGRTDGFIPTIVDIRGSSNSGATNPVSTKKAISLDMPAANTNVEESMSIQTAKLPEVNLDVEDGDRTSTTMDKGGNEREVAVPNDSDAAIVHAADDDDSSTPKDNSHLMTEEIEHSNSCFTSEIDIQEEGITHGENEKPELYCIDSSSKIPSPIPIKMESSVDRVEQPRVTRRSVLKVTENDILNSSRNGKLIMVPAGHEYRDMLRSTNRGRVKKKSVYSTFGYTCHLCNKTFQEHELLNEHMILHRNNSLVHSTLKKSRKKIKPFECVICNKSLGSLSSLHQHMMIHNNEKPFTCSVCQKDFRHQSPYRAHMQKHEAEGKLQERDQEKKEQAGKSTSRSVDLGKLVGPSFVKKSLLNLKAINPEPKTTTPKQASISATKQAGAATRETSKDADKKSAAPPKPVNAGKRTASKLSFEEPFFRKKDNTKENVAASPKTVVEKSRDEPATRNKAAVDEADDEVVPLKTFNNVENIVMNATRYIVKLDNLDPNLLKRRIKTPDISIDKNSISGKRMAQKRRIVLTPPDPAKRLKLDQIENIIMDDTSSGGESTEDTLGMNDVNEPDSEDDYPDLDDHASITDTEDEQPSKRGTLTHNELLQVLDDDTPMDHEADKTNSTTCASETIRKSKTENENAKSDHSVSTSWSSSGVRKALQNSSESHSVVMVKLGLPSKEPEPDEVKPTSPVAKNAKPESPCSAKPTVEARANVQPSVSTSKPKSKDDTDTDQDENDDALDAFDAAFQKVAHRRLLMIRNRAAQNDGKVENKYLLGPLFWRKALRRARLNAFEIDQSAPMTQPERAKTDRTDERRTNDPAKLQARAEAKLNSILNKVRKMKNLNNLNLTGPLFWRKTLKLAGVHGPKDLPTLLNSEQLSLQGIQFVDEDTLPARQKSEKSNHSSNDIGYCAQSNNVPSNANATLSASSLAGASHTNDVADKEPTAVIDLTGDGQRKLIDSILHDAASLSAANTRSKSEAEPVTSTAQGTHHFLQNAAVSNSCTTAADSILYDSLTRSTRVHTSNVVVSSSWAETKSEKPSITATSAPTATEADSDVILIDSDNELSEAERLKSSSSALLQEHALADGKTDADTKKRDSKLSTRLTERYKMDVSRCGTDAAAVVPAETPPVDAGNIILNVNGDLQLLAPSDATRTAAAGIQDGANYVLVSDETGAMRLVKEHDLRLLEGNLDSDTSSTPQYVMNVQGENYGNLELIADGGGENLTYALQFDGENYTAVQFVQNDAEVQDETASRTEVKADEKAVHKSGTKFAAPEATADLNHIGKELSDFLNLDYGTLLKNDGTDRAQT